MIINIKQKFIEILLEPIPENFMNFLNSFKEDNYIITILPNNTRTTTKWKQEFRRRDFGSRPLAAESEGGEQ